MNPKLMNWYSLSIVMTNTGLLAHLYIHLQTAAPYEEVYY